MTLVRSIILGAAALSAVPPADGAFVPVSQKRYVFESLGKEFFTQSADNFDAFNASLTAVSQSSSVSSELITGVGSAGPDPTFSINSATSYFELVFEVESATDFSFSGDIVTGVFGSGAAHLSGPGGDIVNLLTSGEETLTWNESGVLQTGIYTLQVFISNSIGADLSTFNFSLAIPAPSALCLVMIAMGCGGRRRSA